MRWSFIVVAALLTLVGCGSASEYAGEEDSRPVEETGGKLKEEGFELRRRHSRHGTKHHHGRYGRGGGHHHKGGYGYGGHHHDDDDHGYGHGHGHGSWGHHDEDCDEERFSIDGPYVDAGKLRAGEQVSVTASVEASEDAEALVYLTIRNLDEEVVFERFFVQSFESGSDYDFEATFLTGSSTPAGKYFVTVRVVDPSTEEVLAESEAQRFRVLDTASRRCASNCGPNRS